MSGPGNLAGHGLDSVGLRRKIAAAKASQAAPKGATAAWRLALARGARYAATLDLEVQKIQAHRRSLAELLEMPPERSLIAVLDGPGEALGLMIIDADALAGIIEMQTMGRVSRTPALPRKPTRTDAAMVNGLIERCLRGLEEELVQDEDLIWAGGFHYASFMDDPRPLGLLLEDVMYRVLQASVSLADGAKTGQILLVLPADGRGAKPARVPEPDNNGAALVFKAALNEQVMAADATLQAVLARVTLPLQEVLTLKVGDPLPLGQAALDQIDLESTGGLRLAGGKLGQNRGMRAVRMHEKAAPAARGPVRFVKVESTDSGLQATG